MPNLNAKPENGFVNEWKVEMLKTFCDSPGKCLINCLVPCCDAKTHRLLLIGDIENYTCCAGAFGPCITDKLSKCTDKCPGACLCCEAYCCTWWAVSGNRFLVQNRFMIQNNFCDNCLICTAQICGIAICLMRCLGMDVDENLKAAVDLFYCAVLGCMQTQVGIELKERGVWTSAPGAPAAMGAMGASVPGMGQKQNQGQPPPNQGPPPPSQM